MKKIIIMLAITISSLAVFAGEENVNNKVLNAFSKEFAGAKDVKWTTNSTFSKWSVCVCILPAGWRIVGDDPQYQLT